MENYLFEKALPKSDDIDPNDLSEILDGFYAEVTKKKEIEGSDEYKNSTLKCVRAGINGYFRKKHCLNIISDHHFIQTNETFKGVTRVNKVKGHGEIDSLLSIESEDFDKLSA